MDEEVRKKLIDKIIAEQDLATLYSFKDFNKSVGILQEYSDGLYYSRLKDFILQNSEIMENFSIKNLYVLLTYAKDEQVDFINGQIDKRLETEEFFCEDLDTEFFLNPIHSNSNYGKINEDLRKKYGDKLLTSLKALKGTEYEKIGKNLKTYGDLANFLKYKKDGIFTPEKLDAISRMIDKNPNALNNMNFGLFQDEIFDMGEGFCEYMSKFPTISYQLILIKDNNPQMFQAIAGRVKTYDDLKENLDELETLITFGARNVFELQNEDIEIDSFTECAYRNSNDFELINVEYGKDYYQRLDEKLKEEYDKASTPRDKLNIYMNKVYSVSLRNAKKLLKDFASDLDNLEISEETREYFARLEKIIELDNPEEIDALFNSNDIRYSATQIKSMQREIQKECAREFSSEFRNTDKRIKQQLKDDTDVEKINYNGKEISKVKLSGKFNMLLHSTNAEFITDRDKVEDYKSDWNAGKNKNNHIISTTYNNQEFLGTAPVGVNGVRYAFTNLEKSNIQLMGVTDLNTYSVNFAYDAAKKQYMSANTLTNNLRRVYSEFGIEREGVVPDYVVLFDDDLPEVLDNTYKAASQFDIPVLYVDKAEIEKNQIQNLEGLLANFQSTNDTAILQNLINTYETNVAGWLLNRSEDIENDTTATARINNERFKDDFKNIQTQIESTVKDFLESQKDNPNAEKEITDVVQILLREIELYETCEETKPISKTKISFDAKGLLGVANESLENIGRSELKVNLDELPTSKKYGLKIKDLVGYALQDKNAVTMEDLKNAKMSIIENLNEKERNSKKDRGDDIEQ